MSDNDEIEEIDAVSFLADFRDGRTKDEVTAMLREVVQAVERVGKVGEVTIKVKVHPSDDNDRPYAVGVTVEATSKVPKPAPSKRSFFATDAGSLVREDPRQRVLPFKKVLDMKEGLE